MSLRVEKQTIDRATDSLAAHLPNGSLWEAKNIDGSNLRLMLQGLSKELLNAENFISIYNSQFIPSNEFFVSDWEKALGIPDCCFNGEGTLAERKLDVLIKLASMSVQTRVEFIELANLLGVEVSINNGDEISSFDLSFPILFFGTNAESTYTIVVTYSDLSQDYFPLNFDFNFGDRIISKLNCIFKKIIPDNCKLIFRSE